jgi:hypothetical protein
MNEDREHLRLLSIFHYVVAVLIALFACLPFIHFFMGIAMLSGGWPEPAKAEEQFPLMMVGWFLVLFAGAFIALGWTLAICTFLAGRYLAEQTHYTFCLVVAAVLCIFMPFGTVLGIFTIIVLMRPSVKALFGVGTAPPAATPGSG